MTIIEAIKSGKAFRREISQWWHTLDWEKRNAPKVLFLNLTENVFCVDDILADDWEVREE